MRAQRFGEVTVHTDASTTFEVNGTNYTGSAGLDALAVRTLLIENPNRLLTIHPPALPGSPEEFS